MSETINLALCDDMQPFCHYLQRSFLRESDITIVGTANSAKACLEMVAKIKPDILLLDIQMEMYDSGTVIIPYLKEASPNTKIIMLTVHHEEDQIFNALTYGAIDYITKSATIEEIVQLVRNVYHNTAMLRPEITQAIINQSNKLKQQNASLLYIVNIVTQLTTSEYQILKDLCSNMSYKEIARKRFVEEVTIRSQISRILKKFETNDINEIIKILRELRFFEIVKL